LPPCSVTVEAGTLDRLELGLPSIFLDISHELLRVDLAGNDVIGEYLLELVLVLWFQQAVEGCLRNLVERLVGGREYRERTLAA
jgi:hypothetical protein